MTLHELDYLVRHMPTETWLGFVVLAVVLVRLWVDLRALGRGR